MLVDVEFVGDYDGPDVRRYREANGMVSSIHSEGTRAFVAALRATGDHAAVHYISPTTEIVARVCEAATGSSLAQLIERYVWIPMRAEHDADLLLDQSSLPRSFDEATWAQTLPTFEAIVRTVAA